MRILSISPTSEAGGSVKSLITLAKGLKDQGHEITVVAPRKGYLVDILKENNIDVYLNRYIVFNVWPPTSSIKNIILWLPKLLRLILYFIPSILTILKLCKQIKPNLIHSNSSIFTCGYFSAKLSNITHVWHIREYVDRDFQYRFFPNQLFRQILLRNSKSISITKEINETYKLKDKGIIIYNGISKAETNCVKSLSNLSKGKYFLYVGKVAAYKGVTDLIISYCNYYKQNGRKKLILCGSYEEEYLNYLLCMITNNKIPKEQVLFKNQVGNIGEYMQAAHALIIPSYYEAFGRVMVEAVFNNCPIIARYTGGLKEQLDLGLEFTNHEIGYKFDTIDDLTKAMLKIDCTPNYEIEQTIHHAQLTANHYFSTDSYIDSCIKYFNQTIEDNL